MKKLSLIIVLVFLSINVYATDKLNSHEQFEKGPLPKIINYDTDFRPPQPMPIDSAPLPDDEYEVHSTSYDVRFTEIKE